ncbi:MAG: ABC transporter ATP-binding protein [Anaerolineae bacterium]|nr:ABC transporter ATP-binding protein [Anaerolineae bacterium]
MRAFWRILSYMRSYLWQESLAFLSMLGIAGAGLIIPAQIGRIVDEGIIAGDRGFLAGGVAIVLGLSVLRGALVFVQGYLTESVSQGIAYDMRNQLYDKLQRLSFSYYDQVETGQLLARATSDVEMLRRITGRGLLMLANATLTTLGTAVVLVAMNPLLALISLAATPLMVWVVQRYAREIRPLTLQAQNRLALLTSRLEQNLKGLAVVRAFAQEQAEMRRFEEENARLFSDNVSVVRLSASRQPQIRFLVDVSTVLLLWAGGRLVIGGALTLGALVAFNAYLLNMIQPLRRFGWLTSMISSSVAGAERVFEILDVPEEVQNAPDAQPLPPIEGRVRFENVSFGYLRDRPVLQDVSFTIEPGSVVALLGPTGSGKTTIINLLMRFYDPSAGRVLMDGFDISKVTLESLRRQVGIVLQETMLFGGTVRENIAFGKSDATEEEIERAARLAAAHDFIMELPQGYDTLVGEKGVMLSGGQRQRIAIARAVLKDPRVLILDDATSSVDSETEVLIQEALWRLMPGRTSFIIAQRVSTARRADVILLLDQGRLVDMGTHEELLARSGLYADIYHSQLLPERQGVVNSGEW